MHPLTSLDALSGDVPCTCSPGSSVTNVNSTAVASGHSSRQHSTSSLSSLSDVGSSASVGSGHCSGDEDVGDDASADSESCVSHVSAVSESLAPITTSASTLLPVVPPVTCTCGSSINQVLPVLTPHSQPAASDASASASVSCATASGLSSALSVPVSTASSHASGMRAAETSHGSSNCLWRLCSLMELYIATQILGFRKFLLCSNDITLKHLKR